MGTPDVIGIYKILTRGIPQTPIEVISAEIAEFNSVNYSFWTSLFL